jgi:peptidyl-prolyl cis-trans isomerase C
VTAETINTLRQQWQKQYQRTPTSDQLRGIVDDHVREQVLYREAVALGLDRDDSIVRRRLAQKMEFLSADIFEVAAPDDAALERYLDQHADRYARPARVTFRHVYFSSGRRGAEAATAARAALTALAQPGASDETLGDPFVGEYEFNDRSDAEIANAFGKDFAAGVIEAAPGEWVGPIASTYGLHLVRVSHRGAPQPVRLADVREAVARDFRDQRRRDANRDLIDRLRQRYEINIDEAAINSATPELIKTAQVTP